MPVLFGFFRLYLNLGISETCLKERLILSLTRTDAVWKRAVLYQHLFSQMGRSEISCEVNKVASYSIC